MQTTPAAKTQPEHKNGRKPEPVVLPEQTDEFVEVAELPGGLVGANGDGVQKQAARLGDARLQTVQLQRMAMQIGQVQGNQHLQRVIQRQAGEVGGSVALIAEDNAETLQPGQMRKSEFLAQLKEASCAAADEALSGTIYTTVGCPYITKVFSKLPGYPPTKIERMIRTYTPESIGVTTAAGYITPITNRLRIGIARWLESGETPALPEGLSSLGEEGRLEQGSASEAGIQEQVAPNSGSLLFKARQGGAKQAEHPEMLRAQLGPGRALDSAVTSRMGSAFGHDFSGVRLHTDSRANQLSADLNARAFTVGKDVAFAAGEFQPGSLIGDALIAHELAHTAQQGLSDSSTVRQNGSSEYSALEDDADVSAVSAVASLWGNVKGLFSRTDQDAMPRLQSKLRLSRCSNDKDTRDKVIENWFWGVISHYGPPGMPTPDPDAARGILEMILGFAKRDFQNYTLFGDHADPRFETVDWGWYQRQAREQGMGYCVDDFTTSIRPLFLNDLWNDSVHRGDSGNLCQ